jgi:hypothetical protein
MFTHITDQGIKLMTRTEAYIASLIRDYGNNRAAMLRLIAQYERPGQEGSSPEVAKHIAASLRAALK